MSLRRRLAFDHVAKVLVSVVQMKTGGLQEWVFVDFLVQLCAIRAKPYPRTVHAGVQIQHHA